ncbi:MAG: hypothetical protein GY862_08225 [Gammaproteobacteria bacterium]|nr:hypothetical protein [Gammaproteobacteria bacterium]
MFHATYPEQSVFSVAEPSAFGFVEGREPASARKQRAMLSVNKGETLALVGGNIVFDDSGLQRGPDSPVVSAPDGRITLVSAAAAGEAPLQGEMMTFSAYGDITLKDERLISANLDVGNGRIMIRGGNIVFENVYVSADTKGDENGRGITLKADNTLRLAGSKLSAETLSRTRGNSGDIVLTAKQVELDGGQASTATRGAGDAGNITVSAKISVHLGGRADLLGEAKLNSETQGRRDEAGKGGDIHVRTGHLEMTGGRISSSTRDSGDAGDIVLTAETLALYEGAEIAVSVSGSSGAGGDLTINAGKSVLISGRSAGERPSALTSNALGRLIGKDGPGGNIRVITPQLHIENGGSIEAFTETPGPGGNIVVNAERMKLSGTAAETSMISADSPAEAYTKLREQVTDTISAESTGTGQAGNIKIMLAERLEMHHAAINTDANGSDGGNISITSPGYLLLQGSLITSSATDDQGRIGDGGHITLTPEFLVLDDSAVYARAEQGRGGRIEIATKGIYNFSPGNIDQYINAEASGGGIHGIVEINSPENDAVEKVLIALPAPLPKMGLLPVCPERGEGSRFSFVKRGGMPDTPERLRGAME